MTKSRGLLPTRRYWSEPELELLRDMYPHCHSEDVAALMERTTKQLYVAAKARGIAKTDEYLESPCAGRMSRERAEHPNSVAHRFKKGQPSWSKGTKGVVGVQEACRATQFKTRRPEESRNYVPLGTLRISKDGYLERKVTDDRTLVPARRWTAVARLVWEATHGPVGASHMVVFRPGKFTIEEGEITLDSLECISRAENARRNHPRSKSPELARLVQLKGAITRQVNRIAREAEEASA